MTDYIGGKDNENYGNTGSYDLWSKVKERQKSGRLTQEQLATKLMVSRQAITKWESDKGMPDIENLKNLSRLLGVSLDHLLDDGECLDLSVLREPIDLNAVTYRRSWKGRWTEKAGKKDLLVREKYPQGEIHYLVAEQVPTKAENVADNLIGFLTTAPFGIPQFLNSVKNLDKEFYLVKDGDTQLLVMVTDEFMESRKLSRPITEKKFQIGDFRFTVSIPIAPLAE